MGKPEFFAAEQVLLPLGSDHLVFVMYNDLLTVQRGNAMADKSLHKTFLLQNLFPIVETKVWLEEEQTWERDIHHLGCFQ